MKLVIIYIHVLYFSGFSLTRPEVGSVSAAVIPSSSALTLPIRYPNAPTDTASIGSDGHVNVAVSSKSTLLSGPPILGLGQPSIGSSLSPPGKTFRSSSKSLSSSKSGSCLNEGSSKTVLSNSALRNNSVVALPL